MCIYSDIIQEVVYFSWKNKELWIHLTEKFFQVSVMIKSDLLRWLAQFFDNLFCTHLINI